MPDDRREVGHHLHHNYIGHEVTVRTPGDTARTGLLVAMGNDRLVLSSDTGVAAVARLLTTRLEVPATDRT